MVTNNSLMWDRFARLGDMIGEEDHDNMAEIRREYKRLMLILCPEIKEELKIKRQAKNQKLNEAVLKALETIKCKKCNGDLKQTRSGSKTVKCEPCGVKYTFKTKKK